MLRPEMPRRPSAARFKLDAQEIADFAIDAIPHFSQQFAFGIADPHVGLQGNGFGRIEGRRRLRIYLPGWPPSGEASGFVLPLDIHHVRAQHPGSIPLSNIYFLIGEQNAKDYEGSCDKTPYNAVRAHPQTGYCQSTTSPRVYTGTRTHGTAGSGNTFHCVGIRNPGALVQRFYVLRSSNTPGICPPGAPFRSTRQRGIGRGPRPVDGGNPEQDRARGGLRLGLFRS